MNERIRELAKSVQCERHWTEEDIEKFAKLIVQDCAGLVQGVPTDTMGYRTADQKIKEHFGVEVK